MDVTKTSIAAGILCGLMSIGLTIYYKKRFDPADLATHIGAVLAGTNIPPAIFLIIYFLIDDPALAQSKLKGYEKYISLAGLTLLLTALLTLWRLFNTIRESLENKAEKSDK